MSFVQPDYKLPCHQTLTRRLESTKAEVAKVVKEDLASASAISITTDLWTSINNDAYFSVTASYITPQWKLKVQTLNNLPMEERHTQTNISACLLDDAQSWNIAAKVKAVLHDGASNMKDAGSTNNWTDNGWAAHKLHLAVISSMGIDKVTNSTLSKCVRAASRLIGHFSHSTLAETELVKTQQAMVITSKNGQPLKLIQHVKTQWNSVFDMFQRLVKLR